MNPIKSFYSEHKPAVIIGVVVLLAWRFWGFLSGVFGIIAPGDGPGLLGAVTDAAANISVASSNSRAKALLKAVAPKVTDALAQQYSRDAAAIASALGQTGAFSMVTFVNKDAVYKLIKPYARVLFGDGGKVWVYANGAPHLRAHDHTMAVLVPLYYDLTKRSLIADLDDAFSGKHSSMGIQDATDKFYFKYIKTA